MSTPTTYGVGARRLATFVSTGYNPATDVPNLLAWYRADTTTNSGGFVDQLTDKKGAVHYTQTLTKRPALVPSGSDPNGFACIVFDGADDCLLQATGHGSMNDCTIFGVVRSSTLNANSGVIWRQGNAGGTDVKSIGIQLNAAGATDPISVYTNPASTNSTRAVEATTTTTVYAGSTPRIMTVRHDSAAANSATPITRSRLGQPRTTNNVSAATVSTIASFASAFGSNKAGSANFMAFGLYEWMICNALLTDEQVNKVELYLARYYALI